MLDLKKEKKHSNIVHVASVGVLSLALFLIQFHTVHAYDLIDLVYDSPSDWMGSWAGSAFRGTFQYLLYGVFEFFSLLVSVAATIFNWAINPDFFSGPNGFFNLEATLAMWKFVRDFLNLFFILGLLFVAFATIFQISSYSLMGTKKILIKILIAALLINFSFPLARIMIDVANVPHVFFR
ncbi:MAG: hypothetical protein WDN67_02635 [Candidatus Moraniibacteriota bacterium]